MMWIKGVQRELIYSMNTAVLTIGPGQILNLGYKNDIDPTYIIIISDKFEWTF